MVEADGEAKRNDKLKSNQSISLIKKSKNEKYFLENLGKGL